MMIKAMLIWSLGTHRSKQRGAAAVEFAIVISLLVLITGGIIEFGRVFWYYDALTKATRDGARFMTTAPTATILTSSTAGIPAAQARVVSAANAAGVSPVLTTGNVSVTCQNAAFQTVACLDGTAPANVRVDIIGYGVTFGSWFAIPLPGGNWLLRPHTTMRYMN